MKKVIAIDGNALLFKAYYATSFTNMMQTSSGVYTNALYSFINIINKIKNEMNYDYLLVAFDAGSMTFRHEKFEDYKGHRSKTPEELVMQFPLVREFLNLAQIPNYEVSGYEADDIIGTLASMAKKSDYTLDIITSDKDMLQLVNDKVSVLLAIKGISQTHKITPDTLNEIWDIRPQQVIDLKGLMGDPSDNIPGVKGIGEKTAIKLIKEYESIEGIYENIDNIKGKLQEKLINGKESAFESKELATIYTNVELPFNIEDLIEKEINYSMLKDFYHRYELKSFIDKVNEGTKVECDFSFQIVTHLNNEQLKEDSYIDFVSFEENYHKDAIKGLIIINDTGCYYIKITDVIKNDKIIDFLKNTNKCTYDLKRNIVLGYWHNIEVGSLKEDIMISTYLIDSNLSLNANVLVDTNFHISTLSNKDLLKENSEIQIENKVKQAYYLNKLIEINKTKLKELELVKLYEMEIEIAKILAKMEITGILIDQDVLAQLNFDYQKTCDKLEQNIYEYAKKEFNINSVKQLGEVLFEDLNLRVIKKTKTGYSTDNDVLTMLIDDHPIIPLIMEYRTYKKLLSTYILPMPDYILSDNRVHTIYNQCLTATGRLSSKEPNLQNIATKSDVQKSIKKSFVAKEGYELLSFDYSQIELRILASFSKDEVFLNAFKNNVDIHKAIAAKAANIKEEDVSKEQRAAAKAINFGIVYGISDFGLAKQLHITRQEAKDFIDQYYLAYPKIKEYLDSLIKQTQETGYTKTILNRTRYIKEIKSNNYNIKEMGKRMAMNTPIQGSAADILKLAMIKVDNMIKQTKYDVKMLLQVHDELIFEVKKEEVEDVKKLIAKEMESAYKLDVLFAVNCSSGKTWYDL